MSDHNFGNDDGDKSGCQACCGKMSKCCWIGIGIGALAAIILVIVIATLGGGKVSPLVLEKCNGPLADDASL